MVECRKCPYAAGAGMCPGSGGSCREQEHALPPGTELRSRYLVGRVLGEGGFGITYMGFDMTLRSPVAVKEYFPPDRAARESAGGPELRGFSGGSGALFESGKERFLREARVMARVMHTPNIVGVRDYFEENNTAYIVMDYLDGVTFRKLTESRGGRIEAGELLRLLRPLFPALAHMHAQGLIHRDINPENLMLSEGKVCLLDFGCARENAEGDATMTVTLRHGYAPIEQYQPSGDGQGPWTDVYALAATMYYCLTGTPPVQAMDRLLEDGLVPPNKLGAGLAEWQERAIMRAMRVLPKRRTRSVEEFYSELYRDGEEKPKKRRGAIIAAGLAAAAVIAAAVPAAMYFGKNADGPTAFGVFDAAVEVRDAENFLLMASDELIPALTVPSGTHIAIDRSAGPVYLDKPMKIEDGASFDCGPSMWTTAQLLVEAGGSFTGSMLTLDGGSLTLGGYCWGSVCTRNGGVMDILPGAHPNLEVVWLESEEALHDPEGLVERRDFLEGVTYPEGSGDAVEVSTAEELERAAAEGVPAVLTGSVTLKDSLTLASPLSISQDATLHTAGFRLKSRSTVVVMGGLDGPLELGDGAVLVNMGEMSLDLSRGVPYSARILNLGSLNVGSGRLRDTLIVNMGTLVLETAPGEGLEMTYGCLYSFGRTTVSAGSRLRLTGSALMRCDGVVTVEDGAAIENKAFIEVPGKLTLRGDIQNDRGLVHIIGDDVVSEGGRVTGGLVEAEGCPPAVLDGVLDESAVAVARRDRDPDAVRVYSTGELLEELARDSGAAIALYGDAEIGDIQLTRDLYIVTGTLTAGDVTLTGALLDTSGELGSPGSTLRARSLTVREGGMVQNFDGTISLSGDLRLSASDAVLTSPMELEGGAITLEDGSNLINSSYITGCGAVRLSGGSILFDRISATVAPGTTLDASGGDYIDLTEWIK